MSLLAAVLEPERTHDLVAALVVAQLAAPALALLGIGIPPLLGRPLSERTTSRLVGTGFATAFLAALVMFGVLAGRGFAPETVHLGTWFSFDRHAATIDLVADGLSVPYVCFSACACWSTPSRADTCTANQASPASSCSSPCSAPA